jgi:tetratricopeptide (TPR) repeat protein
VRLLRTLATILLLGAAAGCSTIPADVREYGEDAAVVELKSVPFHPQERYQCGPAALTTILESAGIGISLDEITDLTYLPGRQGTLQTELLATTRSAGRIPYRIDGSIRAIAAELNAGRPVLVLQNLGVRWYPRWHYAVVVGIDPENDQVVLRSGTDKRRVTRTDTFLRTWRRGDFWAFVALTPGELPAIADSGRYHRAVAAMEAVGHDEAAYLGWRAMLDTDPESTTARFGMANAAHRLGRLEEAERLYRRLIAEDNAMLSARNNLAFVLADQGRQPEAVDEIRIVLQLATANDALLDIFRSSYDELTSGNY